MYLVQSQNYRHQEADSAAVADFFPVSVQVFLQGFPIQVLHDIIGGVVFVEKAVAAYNLRNVPQILQDFGLTAKMLQAIAEFLCMCHCHGTVPRLSAAPERRKIFFDGHNIAIGHIHCPVCGTETAVSKIAAGEISAVKHNSGRKKSCGYIYMDFFSAVTAVTV